MRTRILLGILLCLCVLVLFAVPAQAQQWGSEKTFRVTVPFNFYVGDKMLPAGDYLLKHNQSDNGFTIVGMDGEGIPGVQVNHLELKDPAAKTELIFVRTGDKYVLHQMKIAGMKEVHDVRHDQTLPEPVEVIIE